MCVDKEEVIVQQDNAPPHHAWDRIAVKAAATAGGWAIKFANQLPRSPDFNVLDLGWFDSLQSLQYQKQMMGSSTLYVRRLKR